MGDEQKQERAAYGFGASIKSLMETSLADEQVDISSSEHRVLAGTASMLSLASEVRDVSATSIRRPRVNNSQSTARQREGVDGDENSVNNNAESSYSYAQSISMSMRSLDPSLAEEEVQSLKQSRDDSDTSQRSVGNSGADNISEQNEYGLGQATMASSVINLLNTLAGAGMLALPYAYSKSGYIGGTILLILTAIFSAIGLRLLTKSIETTGISAGRPSSFYTVTSAKLPHCAVLVDVAVAVKCFGVCVSYLITVSDSMVDASAYLLRNFAKEGHFYEKILTSHHFWIAVAVLAATPLCFQRTLDSLKVASAFSLQLKVALVVCIVLYAEGVFDPCYRESDELVESLDYKESTTIEEPTEELECRGDTTSFTDIQSAFQALSLFIYAFTCQQQIFQISNEMSCRSQARMDQVTYLTTAIALILYGVVTIEGYDTFGSHVLGNILLNYPQTALLTAMRIFVAMMVVLSYPLQLDPARRCIGSLVAAYRRSRLFDRGGTGAGIDANTSFASLASEICENEAENLCSEGDFESVESVSRQPNSSGPTRADQVKDNYCSCDSPSMFEFRLTTLSMLLLSLAASMITSDLGFAFAVVGASGSTLILFILPAMIYLSLHECVDNLSLHSLAYIQLILGIIILPASLYFLFTSGK